jgi:hypothetical protein
LGDGSPAWPQKYDRAELEKIRRLVGERSFAAEYLLNAVAPTDTFIAARCIRAGNLEEWIMITRLIDWSGHPTKGKPENLLSRYGIYAGLDVGRFVHPSHLAVIVPLEREDARFPWKERHFVQVASVWLDDEPYAKQIAEIKEILAMGGAFVRVFYDNTRGELVALKEQGLIPRGWHGVTITAERKQQMAQRLLLALEQGAQALARREAEKIPSASQCALQAQESGGEHGEAFTSLMLALEATQRRGPETFYIRDLYG